MWKIISFVFISSCLWAQTVSPIIFSEIMFRPLQANSEFIELYNTSSTNSVDLTKYQIRYHTSAADTIIAHQSGLILQPKQYAVIFEDDYNFAAGIYKDIIPADALVLTIDNKAFGSSGMANTSNRTVRLINAVGDTLISLTYTANNAAGISDEKILMNSNDNSSNWANSILLNGTPGFANSVSPLNNDLQLASISFIPNVPHENDSLMISVLIKNTGLNIADNFTVEIFNDINADSIAQIGERIFNNSFVSLLAGDSLTTLTKISNIAIGTTNIIALLVYSKDENTGNDTAFAKISVLPKPSNFSDVVINEIMYKPLSGEPEWIELFNRSNNTINLKSWRIFDVSSSTNITDSNVIIEPNNYVVIADDDAIFDFFKISSTVIFTNIPSLNNSGDNLKIKDGLGNIIDSVNYLSGWGNNQTGVSLERINAALSGNNAANWASSTALRRATPGTINSVTPKNIDLAVTDISADVKYVKLNSSALLNVKVSNFGIQTADNITVRLFNDINKDGIPQQNEKIDSVNVSTLSSNDSTIVNFNFNAVIAGANNLIAEVYQPQDEFAANNTMSMVLDVVKINEVRNDLVINEIMYAPSAPEPEWIEIFNRSGKTIDLRNYQIADSKDTVSVIPASTIILPDSFFVIAKDSSFYENYGNLPHSIISSFPSLNNSNDDVIILDSLSRVIDSVSYSSVWGGTGGKSLERINPDVASNDSTNWGSAVSGSSPGMQNSIAQKNFDISAVSAFTNPEIPHLNDDVHISAVIKNYGKQAGNFSVKLFADTNYDNTANDLLETINNQSVLPNDSIIINLNYIISNIQNEKDFVIAVNLPDDENTANDTLSFSVRPLFERNSLQLNEVMYRPANGEPEWIEIYNSSNSKINLKNWTISDILTKPDTVNITKENVFVQPQSWFVIAKDSIILSFHSSIPSGFVVSAFPNLNNDIDGVVLRNQYGMTIDSIEYNKNWENKLGFSIERISRGAASTDSSNWTVSTDIEQSTPGRINSAASKKYDVKVLTVAVDPSFPVSGENLKITAKIVNNGLLNAENFSVKLLYGIQNPITLLEEIQVANLLPKDTLTLISENTLLLEDSVQIAAAIIFADDENTSNNNLSATVKSGFTKGSMLISEVMIEPQSGSPEWIELKNVSGKSIDLKNWSVGNLLPSLSVHTITDSSVVLNPNQFLVLASDTAISGIDSNSVFIDANIGSLNNSSDGIVIYDFRDAVIDSLFYDNSFDIEKGFSLERISFNDSTNNPLNWLSSIGKGGGTPGSANSVSALVPQKSKSVVINEIMYNPSADNSEFVELYNPTDKFIELGGFGIFDKSGNFFKVTDQETELAPEQYFVAAKDSSILQNYPPNSLKSNLYITNSSKFNLSNDDEEVILVDAFGNVVDSVHYFDKWNNRNIVSTRNKSLERINPKLDTNDPANWSTSVNPNGATPTEQNSVFANSLSSTTKISISPNPFSPDNDGFEDFSIIRYNLTQTVAQIRIKVFDSRGRKVRTIVSNRASGSSGSVIFDGLDDNGRPLRIGIYILFIEALNSSSGVVETLKEPVVIARKL